MVSLKQLSIIAIIIFSTSLCSARKFKFAVDSIDATTHERVRIAEDKIGDNDFRNFGNVIIENSANKYYITFPFTISSYPPYDIEDEIMPKGTKIIMKLDDGEVVRSQTQHDIKVTWHLLWRTTIYEADRHGISYLGYPKNAGIFKWHDDKDAPSEDPPGDYSDIYVLDWMARFEFTPALMELLSKHRIVYAYSMKGKNKITLPIRRKQSKRIEKSIAALLHQ